MLTLIVAAFLVLWLNCSVAVVREVTDPATNATTTLTGAFAIASSGEPLLDGFRAIYKSDIAKVLSLIAVLGPRRQLPQHHLCQGPADLLAVARRLFPALAVDHPRHAEDAAYRHDRRRCGRLWRSC